MTLKDTNLIENKSRECAVKHNYQPHKPNAHAAECRADKWYIHIIYNITSETSSVGYIVSSFYLLILKLTILLAILSHIIRFNFRVGVALAGKCILNSNWIAKGEKPTKGRKRRTQRRDRECASIGGDWWDKAPKMLDAVGQYGIFGEKWPHYHLLTIRIFIIKFTYIFDNIQYATFSRYIHRDFFTHESSAHWCGAPDPVKSWYYNDWMHHICRKSVSEC